MVGVSGTVQWWRASQYFMGEGIMELGECKARVMS